MNTENHIPVIIGNYAPLRFVLRESDNWNPTLEEINSIEYNYVKLSRISTFLDIGIAPFSLGIAFDGSLVLPATEEFRTQKTAIDKFNETLGILLLGGVYSEAVNPTDISFGTLFFDGYLKNHGGADGNIARFHRALKTKCIGILDAIDLLEPKTILNTEIEQAYKKGKEYFLKIKLLSPILLLNGTSHYVKHQWTESLIFLWTSIEQIINAIWTKEIVKGKSSSENIIEGRIKFLNDFRTWTTSTRIEMLYQNKLVGADIYKLLNSARKARNEFVHSGKKIDEQNARNALEGLFKLLSLFVTDFENENELTTAYEIIVDNQRSQLFPKKTKFSNDEVKFWMEIPPLPGDIQWGDKPYEIIDELVLKPLNGTTRSA